MSAAAPYPAPSSGAGAGGGGGGVGYPGPNDNRAASNSVNGRDRVYDHIQDLKIKADGGFNRQGTVSDLLGDAERALNQARFLLESRRPDLSYVEYLRASEIVVEVVPHHEGWSDHEFDHGGGGMQRYQILQKRINAQAEQYQKIKEIIVNNNMRSGVHPRTTGREELGKVETLGGPNGNAVHGGKIKPSPSPKPDAMHGNPIHASNRMSGSQGSAASADPLRDRLAALRNRDGPINTNRPDSRGSNSSVHSSPGSLTMPNASDYGSRHSFDAPTSAFSAVSLGSGPRPQGPRGMPNGSAGPPIPGKLPLNTSFAAMPQPPKATYSPARNMQTSGNIELPRHTPRSLASTSSRRTSLAQSSASYTAPNGTDSGDYFPAPTRTLTNGSTSSQQSQMIRRKSVHVPKETRISAERLYDYLERFNILLIDFRPRQDFDQGHIYSRNVMCVDPIHVMQGMSAEQLLERMVISPEMEQELFMNRDKFDLVVYYDAQTQSETFLSKPIGELQTKLKYLHEALYDFNHDRPLQRPPILLIGGVDAWADLVGNQALATSDTASRVKLGRPVQRRPVGGAPLRNPKRRLREYNPLDPEEEQQWRERARAESVHLPTPTSFTGEGEEPIHEEPEDDTPDSAIINEFNERFPEAGALERYAFGPLQPARAAPEPPPKIPVYPAAPPSSMYPTAPARPAPAAPRTSYMGVSDRAGSQNVPAARSMSSVPYIPVRYLTDAIKLPRTGLDNFRYTCYMNATLQALSHTKPLSMFFISNDWSKLVQRDNWKGTKGIMPSLYANLIRSLWAGDVNYIRPSTFRTFCGRQNSQWIRDDQEQDAKEFYDFLIDCLHEDLNVQWARTPLREMTREEEAKRERMPKPVVARLEWDRFTHRSQSFINDVFGGQYASKLVFDSCGHTSTTYDAFYALSVEIPNMRNPTLDDCMRSFTKEERLDPEERAKCDQCNVRRDSTKRITITRAPQYLVLHFKRFSQVRGRATRKISSAINFPLENFDLEPYMLPQPSSTEMERLAQDYGPSATRPDPGMTAPFKYDAYAVIRHHGGSIESGHYTTLVKDKNNAQWRSFNDRTHTDFIPGKGRFSGDGDIRNGEAYIVFYQRSMQSPIGPGGAGKF